ncbi:MAG: hypothetical protein ACP5C3_08435 [Methanomicrobiales archaeon]
MDERGYIISSLSFLLVIPAILLVFVLLDVNNNVFENDCNDINSKSVNVLVYDLKKNIPITAMEVINETTWEVINTKPLLNSRDSLKKRLQTKIDKITNDYQKYSGADVTCNIISIDNGKDPFVIEINSSINVSKNKDSHYENFSQEVSVEGFPDCIPFIICGKYGEPSICEDRINYNKCLFNFLNTKTVNNSYIYINATSPLFIKKCPYTPYNKHQNLLSLKNCIENGYYHESNDGACFLCRLEGKCVCQHYGIETFIIPPSTSNEELIFAPCSSDHVIFNESYEGRGLQYHFDGIKSFNIYLDNGHRSKYGLENY